MPNLLNENQAKEFAVKKRQWRWPALLLATLIILSSGISVWLSTTPSGLRSLGSAISHFSAGNLSFEGLDGTLSGSFSMRTMRFESDDLLVIARDMQLSWQPGSLKEGRLDITSLTAREVEIVASPSTEPKSLPVSLESSFALSLHKLDIGTLRLTHEEGGTPDFKATELAAQLESDGRRHRLSNLRAGLEFGGLTASGQIDGNRPFDLNIQTELTGRAGLGIAGVELPEMPGARISAAITGNLEQLDIRMNAIGGADAGLTGGGEALLRPYAPILVAALRLSLHGLDPHVFSPHAPKASLSLQADLHETSAGRLEGGMAIENAEPAPLDLGGLPLLQVRAQTILSAELLQFNALTLAVAGGGTVSGNLLWRPVEAAGTADLAVSRIDPVRLDTRLRAANLSGGIKLSGDAQTQQGILTLSDKALSMDIIIAKTGSTLTLDKMHLKHGRSALTGHGKLGLDERQPFMFEGRLQHFDLSVFAQTPRTSLNSTIELAGELTPETSGTIRFNMSNSQVAGQSVSGDGRVVFADLDLASPATARASGKIELWLGANRLLAQGGFGRKGDRLQLELAAPALAQIGHGFSGSLMTRATLESRSTNGEPEWPDMIVSAEGRDLALPGNHFLASFMVDGNSHGDAISLKIKAVDYKTEEATRLRSLQLEVEGSRARHKLWTTARLDDDLNLTLRAIGGLKIPLQTGGKGSKGKKRQSGKGWKDTTWLGEISELAMTGGLPFHLTRAASLEAGRERISLGTAELVIAGGGVQFSGTEWTPQQWLSRGKFSGIGLRPGGPARMDENEKNGKVLRLGGEWDIASTTQLTGSLRVTRESGDWILPGNMSFSPLGLQALQLSAHAGGGSLAVQLNAQGERLGMVNANVSAPLAKSASSSLNWTVLPSAPLTGRISADMGDMSWLGPLVNNNLRSGGQVALQADVTGTLGKPRLKGQIRGDDLVLALLDQGVRLEQGKLAARFDEESLHMDVLSFVAPHAPPPADRLLKNVKTSISPSGSRASGIMNLLGEYGILDDTARHKPPSVDDMPKSLELPTGPGSLQASGTLNFMGEQGDLEFTASRLPLAQRADRWIIVSGGGRARLEKNVLTLNGNLLTDAGLIAQPEAGRPQLPDDVIVMGREPAARQAPRIRLETTLDLGGQFYIRASGLEGRLAGQLRVHGEPGQQLRTTGTITARNANFEAYGQRLMVERGIVSFQGPIDDPGLNVLAVRTGLPVEAGVEVTGSVRRPRVRLVSTPAVSDLEKLSWITLGRAPEGKADASLLMTAANAILGGQSGGVTDKIAQALGVDELSIRQARPMGGDVLMGQIGTVGKRLSNRAYISYEQALTAVAGVTKLAYSLTSRITVVTRAGIDNAIDVLYTMRFD
ncbi:autotransporter secretion inner membrane protein TamB [Nitrosospira sp. Nsp5]|uniref:Autotransporter secretion inner membrane protein TamB n=1 Tax=Nitrosospira multiformis TaxID=1231 RepID=A0ABY0THS3_9PROT|nr:autotransporter secretion inner membrane protein TamB [Nitrosospira sp. Nsp5]SDQ63059.1 autotransporter secretion inner membrane protein TamB [Nitrosospira multiformis]